MFVCHKYGNSQRHAVVFLRDQSEHAEHRRFLLTLLTLKPLWFFSVLDERNILWPHTTNE